MTATSRRKRGRPKSAATLEAERAAEREAELLRNRPQRHGSNANTQNLQALLASLEEIRESILKDYADIRTMPQSLMFNLAELGDESLTPEQSAKLLEDFREVVAKLKAGRLKGAYETKKPSEMRANKVLRQEEVAKWIDGIRTAPHAYTVSSVAQRLFDNWDRLGDKEDRPAVITLRRWIQRYLKSS